VSQHFQIYPDKYGLAGKTDEDKLRADMIVHCVDDVVKYIVEIRHCKDESVKKEKQKKFIEEQLPESCGLFEKLLKQNHGGDGYFVGDSLTWADLAIFQHLTSYIPMCEIETKHVLEKYPKLMALSIKVEKSPKIAAWLAKRPVTVG